MGPSHRFIFFGTGTATVRVTELATAGIFCTKSRNSV